MTKKMVFMMGSPAAGKSFIASKIGLKRIDCDLIKETHPDYDPENPNLIHEWSRIEMEKQFQKSLKENESVIVDGTGANSDKIVRRIIEAQDCGFTTEVIYVTCPLKECLKRNKMRTRIVPESIIREKYKDIKYSFEIVSKYADKQKIIHNY